MLKGDIYWADLGKVKDSNSSVQKGFRPILIIQNNIGNRYSPTVIVSAITSQINKAKLPTHYLLKASEYKELMSNSIVLLEQIYTIDKKDLGEYITSISDIDMFLIDIKLKNSFQLFNKSITVIDNILTTVDRIKRLDGFIIYSNNLNLNIDKKDMKKILDSRSKRLNSLVNFCRNNNLNINEFYTQPNILKNLTTSIK